MSDQPMDRFDARLVSLMTAYGDGAVSMYDAAAIAGVAFRGRPRARGRLVWLSSPRARIALAVVVLASLAAAVALVVGSRQDTWLQRRIVLGPSGPDRSLYHLAVDTHGEVTIENQSDIAWVPWAIAEKDFDCHLVSGPTYSGNPCTVGPHQVVSYNVYDHPRSSAWPIWFTHDDGTTFDHGIPVAIWPVGPKQDSSLQSRIVIGPTGPDPGGMYRLAVDDQDLVTVENQSGVAWVAWGLARTDLGCSPVSGPPQTGGSCIVGPHQVVRFRVGDPSRPVPWLPRFAPEGTDYWHAIPEMIWPDYGS